MMIAIIISEKLLDVFGVCFPGVRAVSDQSGPVEAFGGGHLLLLNLVLSLTEGFLELGAWGVHPRTLQVSN